MADRQFVTVADALRLVPGMTIAPTGGLGSVTSLFPRGGESDYTLVLVDGVKLNSFGGGFDFGHLTTFGLRQVEVVRGPQSAVFGSDAIGGVVQLRSAIGGRPAARRPDRGRLVRDHADGRGLDRHARRRSTGAPASSGRRATAGPASRPGRPTS